MKNIQLMDFVEKTAREIFTTHLAKKTYLYQLRFSELLKNELDLLIILDSFERHEETMKKSSDGPGGKNDIKK